MCIYNITVKCEKAVKLTPPSYILFYDDEGVSAFAGDSFDM